jgi:hypothetical protein
MFRWLIAGNLLSAKQRLSVLHFHSDKPVGIPVDILIMVSVVVLAVLFVGYLYHRGNK